jgi:acetyl esterase/lipase
MQLVSRLMGAVWCLLLFLGSAPATTNAASLDKRLADVVRDIPYPGSVMGERRRSLDLYLPVESKGQKPPLLIFVHGGFWLLPDDDFRIGPAVVDALVPEGIAVALLRYRLAPGYPHPAQAEDVAAAVAMLIKDAKRYGYDPNRIFLSGHSAGGHLAALMATDRIYLARHRASPDSLAGVISFSGLFDLVPRPGISDEQRVAVEKTFGRDPAALRKASPISYARRDVPPFLLLSAQRDFPGFANDAKKFYEALEAAGVKRVQRWIVPDRDHFTLMRLGDQDNEGRMLLLEFMQVKPLPPEFAVLVNAKRRWRDPPVSTLPFWRYKQLIRSYPVDQRFLNRLLLLYSTLGYELQEWSLEKFFAIDLFTYLDRLPPEKRGRGDYLMTTNLRGEKQFWKRDQIEAYRPVIVIGLDDEKNLFRLGVFYRPKREYSWKNGAEPPMMARPVGAFVYFLKEPPEELRPQSAQYAFTENSFKLVGNDPLAPIKDLKNDLYETVTFRNGCIYCHELRGSGAQSHHVVAANGAAHGGNALPLESYPPEVWRKFIFEQSAIAEKIGAHPNLVPEAVRQPLFELVNGSRLARQRR